MSENSTSFEVLRARRHSVPGFPIPASAHALLILKGFGEMGALGALQALLGGEGLVRLAEEMAATTISSRQWILDIGSWVEQQQAEAAARAFADLEITEEVDR